MISVTETDMLSKIDENYDKQASSIIVRPGYHFNLYTGKNPDKDFGEKFTRWNENLGTWDNKLSYYECKCGASESCNYR